MNYEQNLKELEKISEELTNPKTTLNEAIEKFEKSLKIAKEAMQELKVAEGKISVLKKELDSFNETPFTENN